MKFSVAELRGVKSYAALQAFNTLMLGLTLLPEYIERKNFLKAVEQMPLEDRKAVIREAANHVNLMPDEIEALLAFALDANKVPFGAAQIAGMNPLQIREVIVEVCFAISEIKIDILSDDEKKN